MMKSAPRILQIIFLLGLNLLSLASDSSNFKIMCAVADLMVFQGYFTVGKTCDGGGPLGYASASNVSQ